MSKYLQTIGKLGGEQPIIKQMVQLLIERFEHVSLLAVCPNSALVTRAALRAAKEANAPILFAATLNQVDRDGGYTGWTPRRLSDILQEEAERLDFGGPVLPCLDHGGPWLKDEHAEADLSLPDAMGAVKRSIEACLDAGYALLHIDPTVDRTLPPGEAPSTEKVVQRTLELISHAENYRQEQGIGPVSYEVGTEEVHGGLANIDNFDDFLEGLDVGLKTRGLEEAWPCFVVGKVGTDLHTTTFDPEMASRLTSKVRVYGALIKGHYTDGVDNPEVYPLSGMGGANVGPELTEVEYEALADLARLERKLGEKSGFEPTVKHAVLSSERWKKWLQPEEEGLSFDELDAERQQWLIRSGSRYIWTNPTVQDARERLFANVRPARNGEEYVIWRIKETILKYYHAFNLIDFNERLKELA